MYFIFNPITKSMGFIDIHQPTYDQMKIKMSRKNNEMEELQEKLEDVKKQVELDSRRVSELKIEVNKISIAIEKIKEIGQSLDQKYLEQSQNDLVNNLVNMLYN